MLKSRKEYFILIAVIVVLALVYVVQQNTGGNRAYNLPHTPTFTAEELTRIDITTPEQSMQLAKQDGKWVMLPEGYPVDERQIILITESLANFKLTAIISENTADYARYQLDDATKIDIKAYKGDTKLLDVALGAVVANNFRHSYVKLAGDKNVYHGRGNLRTFFDTDDFTLRVKTIVELDPAQVNQIVLKQDNEETVVKSERITDAGTGDPTTIWFGPNETLVTQETIDGFLAFVRGTGVYDFLEKEAANALRGQQVWSLTIVTNDGKRHLLTVYVPKDKNTGTEMDDLYIVVSSDVLSPFTLTDAQQSDIIKRFSELFKTF